MTNLPHRIFFRIVFQRKEREKNQNILEEEAKAPHYEYVENDDAMDMFTAPDVIEEPRVRKPSAKLKVSMQQTVRIEVSWFESRSASSQDRVIDLNQTHKEHAKVTKLMTEVFF